MKHNKHIYISGPMTGLPEFNFPAFHAAAAKLRQCGHTAVNPAEINTETDGDWHEYLKADIKALCDCDALALLPGWENSKGAHLELHIAHRLGLEIGTVDDFVGHKAERTAIAAMTDRRQDVLTVVAEWALAGHITDRGVTCEAGEAIRNAVAETLEHDRSVEK